MPKLQHNNKGDEDLSHLEPVKSGGDAEGSGDNTSDIDVNNINDCLIKKNVILTDNF